MLRSTKATSSCSLFLFVLLIGAGQLKAQQKTIREIKTVMLLQQEAWNAGDIKGFMQGYWNSDSLVFIGKSGLTYGWNQTLQNYTRSYPDKETMGALNFELIRIAPTSATSAYVIGKWSLKRAKGDVGGAFLLEFKKFKDGWKIVADHTS
jgi:ketosteroid isomerase-like protein